MLCLVVSCPAVWPETSEAPRQSVTSKAMRAMRERVGRSTMRQSMRSFRWAENGRPEDAVANAKGLFEIPCLHLDAGHRPQIGNGDIARLQPQRGKFARISAIAGARFVAASVRQRERRIPTANAA